MTHLNPVPCPRPPIMNTTDISLCYGCNEWVKVRALSLPVWCPNCREAVTKEK